MKIRNDQVGLRGIKSRNEQVVVGLNLSGPLNLTLKLYRAETSLKVSRYPFYSAQNPNTDLEHFLTRNP